MKHFYRCFGCGKEHDAQMDAIVCCAVTQEIWQCEICNAEFATQPKAKRHAELHRSYPVEKVVSINRHGPAAAEIPLSADNGENADTQPEPADYAGGDSYALGWHSFPTF